MNQVIDMTTQVEDEIRWLCETDTEVTQDEYRQLVDELQRCYSIHDREFKDAYSALMTLKVKQE